MPKGQSIKVITTESKKWELPSAWKSAWLSRGEKRQEVHSSPSWHLEDNKTNKNN